MAGLAQTYSPYSVNSAMAHPAWIYLILHALALPYTAHPAPVRFC